MPLPQELEQDLGRCISSLSKHCSELEERIAALTVENVSLKAKVAELENNQRPRVELPGSLRREDTAESTDAHQVVDFGTSPSMSAMSGTPSPLTVRKGTKERNLFRASVSKLEARFEPLEHQAHEINAGDSGKYLVPSMLQFKDNATERTSIQVVDSGESLAASKFGLLRNDPFTKLGDDNMQKLTSASELLKTLGYREVRGPLMHKVVESLAFKTVAMLAIGVNAIYLGVAADQAVSNSWKRLNGEHVPEESIAVDVAFAIWFSIEIILRAIAQRRDFIMGEEKGWNLFDVLLVVESIVGLIFDLGATLSFLRILRVFRLVRVVRVVRTVPALRKLRTLIFSILNCFTDLCWAFSVVILILFIFSIIFDNAVSDYFKQVDPNNIAQMVEAAEIHKYFGNLYETMLSMWSAVSGGNDWMAYGELLRKLEGGELYFMIFNAYIAFCVIGLFNVVTGVFVDSAVCSRTEDEVVAGYLLDLQATTAEITAFFKEADSDQSDTLSYEEFRRHLHNPQVKAYFSGLDIDPDEALIIFTLLDVDNSDQVSIKEFVNGTMKMKGYAKSMDLLTLMYDSAKMTNKISRMEHTVQEQLDRLGNQVAMLCRHVLPDVKTGQARVSVVEAPEDAEIPPPQPPQPEAAPLPPETGAPKNLDISELK